MFPFNTDELLHVATCHHLTLFRDRRGTRHGTCTLPSLVAVAGMRRIGNSLSLSLFLWLARLLPVCELQKLLRLRMQLAEKLRICITTGRDAGTDREREKERDNGREREWENGGARAGMHATHTWQLRFTTTN